MSVQPEVLRQESSGSGGSAAGAPTALDVSFAAGAAAAAVSGAAALVASHLEHGVATTTGTALAFQVLAVCGLVVLRWRSAGHGWVSAVVWMMTGVFIAELMYLLSLR